MQRRIAGFQLVLGSLGMLLWGYSMAVHRPAFRALLEALQQVTEDAEVQLEAGDVVLEEWTETLCGFERFLQHQESTVVAADASSDQVSEALAKWKSSVDGFRGVARDGREVLLKLESLLPLQIPIMELSTRDYPLEIPQLEVTNRKVDIPFPTAELGSRKVTLDLGLTEVSVDVPEIQVGSSKREVTVPDSAKVTTRKETVRIPDEPKLSYKTFLTEEKNLLQATSREVGSMEVALESTSRLLSEMLDRMATEVQPSIRETQVSLNDTRQSLRITLGEEMPRVHQSLKRQREEVQVSRQELKAVHPVVDGLFWLLGLLPAFVLTQGGYNWSRSLSSSKN